MAKRKKSRKGTRRRKRGMGSVPGGYTKRALLLVAGIAGANLAQEGMAWLAEQKFMQPAPVAEGQTAPKINIKQAALSGGVMLGAGAGSVLIKNEYVSAALAGVATVASVQVKEDLVKPALGMGNMDDFLELYKNKRAIEKDLKGANVQLAGTKSGIEL